MGQTDGPEAGCGCIAVPVKGNRVESAKVPRKGRACLYDVRLGEAGLQGALQERKDNHRRAVFL